jgi:hypothetical protein
MAGKAGAVEAGARLLLRNRACGNVRLCAMTNK